VSGRAPALRRLLLLAAGATVVAAVLGGLARVGFDAPGATHAAAHGPLFVLGVLANVTRSSARRR
jgi:hypothetical protein